MDLKELKDDDLIKKIKMKRQHHFKIIEDEKGFSSLSKNLLDSVSSILEGKKPTKKDEDDEKEIKIGKEKTEVDVKPETKNPDEDGVDDDEDEKNEKDSKEDKKDKKKMKKEHYDITESLAQSIKRKYLSEPKFPSKIKTTDDKENSLNPTTKYVTD